MENNENKLIRRRIANAYLSSVISISMVLLLVGVSALLLVNTKSVSDYFKENVKVSVILKQDAGDSDAMSLKTVLDTCSFVRGTEFVSKAQGEREMAEMLGKDFLDVFSTSPIPLSLMISLKADYVSNDSIAKISAFLGSFPQVDEVVCQESLVDALNSNLSRISAVLGIFILLMLFISFVLINNTMRLTIYARRFSVHTMKLVGATRSFIRAPFLIRALLLGLFSSLIAIVLLVALLFVIRREFSQLLEIFTLPGLVAVMGIVIASGILICVASTYLVVNRLVSSSKDELYY